MTDLFDPLRRLAVPPPTGRHRLFHGRGGCFPGLEWLTVDYYPPVLLATQFQPQPEAVEQALITVLNDLSSSIACEAVVLQRRVDGRSDTRLLAGDLPDTPVAREGALRFPLDFSRGQNIGFFADMAPGREWLAANCRERKVLNLFAFTCAFSVVALANGARSVVNIDLSEAALSLGQQAHQLNGLDAGQAEFLPHNIFRSWKKLHSLGRYDIIIIDPPSEQKGSFMARRDYARVIRQLHRLLAPQAQVLACLNAPWLDAGFLRRTVEDNLPGAALAARLPFAPGFDENDTDAGLKVMVFDYQRPDTL